MKEVVGIPLVLHGASGLSDKDISECVKRGMCKLNFATELRVAYTDAMKKMVKDAPDIFDPKKYGSVSIKAVKDLVKGRMAVCGCVGKAE